MGGGDSRWNWDICGTGKRWKESGMGDEERRRKEGEMMEKEEEKMREAGVNEKKKDK